MIRSNVGVAMQVTYKREGRMSGNVYVFNRINGPMTRIPNDTLESTTVTLSDSYAPTSVVLARNLSHDDPGINEFETSNTLTVFYGDGADHQKFQMNIDPTSHPLVEDRQLCLLRNIAVFESQVGTRSTIEGCSQMVAGAPILEEQVFRIISHNDIGAKKIHGY